jgi:hypothetical protein
MILGSERMPGRAQEKRVAEEDFYFGDMASVRARV